MRLLRALAVVAALVAFQAWWIARETPTEKRLASAASGIAQADVEIRCPSIWGRLLDVSSFSGTAHFAADGRPTHAELEHGICETFDALADDGFPDDLACLAGETCDGREADVAEAIHVLAHESWHLAGVFDEGKTECYAIQTDAELAARFGASRAAGEATARYALARNPRISIPDYRVTSDCRDGGALDLRPYEDGWPTPQAR